MRGRRDGRAMGCQHQRFLAAILLGIASLAPRTYGAVAPLPDGNTLVDTHQAEEQQKIAKLTGVGQRLRFEANRGQFASRVRFLARGAGYTVHLTADEAVLNIPVTQPEEQDSEQDSASARSAPTRLRAPEPWRLRLIGANADAVVEGEQPLPGKSHYFIGNDPCRRRAGIPQFARVRYRDMYPGVDLVFYGSHDGQLEYDFVLSPSADPNQIRIEVTGGGGRLPAPLIEESGDLLLRTATGDMRLRRPYAYQEVNGARQAVDAQYVVEPDEDGSAPSDAVEESGRDRLLLRLALGAYLPTVPIVVDPVLVYSTFLGGTRTEWAADMAVDGEGNAYVVGTTTSSDFPAPERFGPTPEHSSSEVFIVKLNPTGDAVLYATYLGGSSGATATSLAVDAEGAVYVAGQTTSSDFPTTARAFQPAHASGHVVDAFVTKISPSGDTLTYSTFLGGTGEDSAEGIALDDNNDAYVVGATSSVDFPVINPFQATFSGGGGDPFAARDAFVAELDAAGETLRYGSYLGGSTGSTVASDVAVDNDGSVYIAGQTAAANFPVTPAAFQVEPGGARDGFIAKFERARRDPLYATLLGGSGDDAVVGLAVDSKAQAHVAGITGSHDFPVVAALQPFYAGGQSDAFVTALDALGSHLVYSTHLGGSGQSSSPIVGDEGAKDIVLDDDGNAYVTGVSNSSDFPLRNPFDAENRGFDAFVTTLNVAGALLFSTFLGGESSLDLGNAIAWRQTGAVYVAGGTWAVVADFPTVDPLQPLNQGDFDAFVAKLDLTSSAQLCAYVLITAAAGASDANSGTVAVIEAARRQVTGRFRVGKVTDRLFDLAITSRSGLGYIVDAGPLIVPQSAGETLSQFIAVVNPPPRMVADRISLSESGSGRRSLRHIAISPDDRTLYVEGGTDIFAIDPDTGTPIGSPAADAAGNALVIAPNGRYLFSTSAGRDQVSVIDTATHAVVNVVSFPLGSAPTGAAISPDGAQLYVAARDLRAVGIVDVATSKLADLIPVPARPERLAVSPDGGTLYVLHKASEAFGTISVVDTAARQQVGTVALNQPVSDLAVTPDGKFLYVTNGNAGTVTVLETLTHQIVTIIPVGSSAGRIQLATLPNGCVVAATCEGDCDSAGSVSVAELVRAVNIALGTFPADECSAADVDADGSVTIPELVQAVNHALTGCPIGEPVLGSQP